MRITLICVGRLKSGPERELFERYFARMKGMARAVGVSDVELREIDESRARRPEDRREEEAAAILRTPRAARRACHARRARRLAEQRGLGGRHRSGRRRVAKRLYVLAIGGPDGLSPSLRAKAQRVISFGAMTWPHQLVRVMVGEQLYRALSILAGHPYHRA